MNDHRTLPGVLIAGVATAVLLGIFSLAFAAWAAFDDDNDPQTAANWWGQGIMGPQMMGPQGTQSQSGYMGDHMRWMMGGYTTGSTAQTEGATSQAISIQNFAFSPGNVHVPVGAKVTWKNEDQAPHVATAADGSWTTPNLQKGQSALITFDKAGDYLYICTYHPGMTGRILVQ